MISNEERVQRYAKEVALACGYADPLRQHQISARAAVAVADAEQAELRAEIRRLRGLSCADCEAGEPHACATLAWGQVTAERDRWKARALEEASKEGAARSRAEAAERALADARAKVARYLAALDEARAIGMPQPAWLILSAALAGPEPDTTKDNQ
jgi:hypothetical protein